VTQGYIRFHCLQANSNNGPGGAREANGGNLVLLEIWSVGGDEKPQFHRADPNDDGATNITDGIYILNFLFLGGPPPTCRESADVNNDKSVNITDGIYVLNYLFLGGPAPTSPEAPGKGPCGPDSDDPGSPGDLGCASYTKC
jgi:hypothetical protein